MTYPVNHHALLLLLLVLLSPLSAEGVEVEVSQGEAEAPQGEPRSGAPPQPVEPSSPASLPGNPEAPPAMPYYYVPPIQGYGPPPTPAPPAIDPTAYRHDGFFLRISLGFGPSWAKVKQLSDEFAPSTTNPNLLALGRGGLRGPSSQFELLLGGTPAPGLVIGSGLIVLRMDEPRSSASAAEVKGYGAQLTVLPIFANYYFDPEGEWYAQALVGLASGALYESEPSKDDPAGGGVALGVGAGWEAWIAEQWSLGVSLRVIYFSVQSDEKAADPFWMTFFAPVLAGGFTFH